MVFNSAIFLASFILFFPSYWAINNYTSLRIRNLFVIASSYLFYGWWDWRFLSLIALSSLCDYLVGVGLGRSNNKSSRRALLSVSIIVNLGVLGFFKYFNFFIESAEEILHVLGINWATGSLNIILPVGISFYTFQTLSYTIDCYRNQLEPTKNLTAFFAFVSFFPQLVAGPIERAKNLLPQFQSLASFNYRQVVKGLRLALWGFFKKLVIADNFGLIADELFAMQNHNSISVLLAASCFAIQIYADFSGYSDIAIGLARTLGINLSTNFNGPYFSKSFTEFWQRWHISLSSWFRDYVYIPLGGNRTSKWRMQLNILITFLLSGLWHGANITFVLWGALHGFALIIEKRFSNYLNGFFYSVMVIISVMLFWLVFRAENLYQLKELTLSLIHFSSYANSGIPELISGFSKSKFIFLSIVTVCYFIVEYKIKDIQADKLIANMPKWQRWSFYYALVFLILLLTNLNVKPSFIYFQF